MKNAWTLAGVIGLISIAALGAPPKQYDDNLADLATRLDRLHKVTEKPHKMNDLTAALCARPTRIPHDPHVGYVADAWCNVYVNDAARPMIMSGKGTYPAGSLIVKSKLLDKDHPDRIELFTVMQKMPDDYDPEHGNWQYALIDGKSRKVLAAGKIESCISCHEPFKQTDYVTREYLPADNGPSFR